MRWGWGVLFHILLAWVVLFFSLVVVFLFCHCYALRLLWCSKVGVLELGYIIILDRNGCVAIVHLQMCVIFTSIRWPGNMNFVRIVSKTTNDSQSRSIYIISSGHAHLLLSFYFTFVSKFEGWILLLSFLLYSFRGKLLKLIHCLTCEYALWRDAWCSDRIFAWLATLYKHHVIFLKVVILSWVQLNIIG